MEKNLDLALIRASQKPILFVQGKGGVGKSSVAHAMALIASETHRTLLISIEDPLRKPFDLQKLSPTLHHLNNEATAAFEEYAGLKIGAPHLVKVFLHNRFMRYLAKAAPGLRELVLIGKIGYERKNYDRIIVDMPATGHGLTLFQSLFNWGSLFEGSLLAKDARGMIETLSDPSLVGHLIVSIPEEMPLVESLELKDHILRIFPKAEIAFIANRLFPAPHALPAEPSYEDRPFSRSAREHALRKSKLEQENLEIWRSEKFSTLPFLPPPPTDAFQSILSSLVPFLKGNPS